MDNKEEFLKLIPFAKSLNILFVEDNIDVQIQIKKMLSNIFDENKIDVVSNGNDAIESYKKFIKNNKNSYDILITDISMPHVDGFELCSKILEINKEQAIMIISAYSNAEKIDTLKKMGIQDYIQKPIDNRLLINSLTSLLKKVQSHKN